MILIFTNNLSKHGMNPVFTELLALDLSEKYEIKIFSDVKNKLLRLINMIENYYRYYFNAKLIIIDLYSTNAYYYGLLLSLLSVFHKKPYFIILSGGDLKNRYSNSKSFKYILNNATNCISPSKYLYNYFNSFSNNVIYIPNYLDINKYPYSDRDIIKPKLLWVRSFHSIYNPEMAIELFSELLKHYEESELCMVGPDKDGSLERIKYLIQNKKLGNSVYLPGKLSKEEIIEISKNYDIFINTTNFDNHPVSLLEAMALGMPIISTSVQGIPYLLNSNNSILVKAGDVNGMLKGIISFVEDPHFARQLALVAREEIEKQFSKEIIIPKWEGIINSNAIIE